jgi:hypothetical protein
MSKDYNLKISTDQTKIMVFKGKHSVCFKIEIDSTILEQVKKCKLSLEDKPDFDKKINRFQNIHSTVRKYLKKTHTGNQMKY